MDITGEISDIVIERLKKEKRFENWSDEKFSRLRTLFTTEIDDTEEATEELTNAFMELIMEGDEEK